MELTKPTQRINGEDAWSLALQGGNAPAEIDAKSSLREEFQLLEGRLKFIREALDTGVLELDRVHGRASLEICKEVRPQFTKQIEKLLGGIRAVCEANEDLETLRSDLERDGVRSGSLPSCTFGIGGRWCDEFGGRVTDFLRYIADNYPELTRAAGQAIRAKLKELNAKVGAFIEQEEL